jgi:predicted pyridoxine 5'-phosphate oxidase superfamily flavin-nucleotide-binding protein
MNYHEIAFTDAVLAEQGIQGSRDKYAGLRGRFEKTGLSESEVSFISDQDSFFMASLGQSGFPYIQHRGGPKGFLKVLDSKTLGFVDFSGNQQYISTGNLADRKEVSLFLISYPNQARLKIFARARIVSLESDPDLLARLNVSDYKHTPERMIIFDLEAYDWNCPQHITQRYTREEIEEAFGPKLQRLAELEEEVAKLRGE